MFLSTEIFSKRRKIFAWIEEKPELLTHKTTPGGTPVSTYKPIWGPSLFWKRLHILLSGDNSRSSLGCPVGAVAVHPVWTVGVGIWYIVYVFMGFEVGGW